ncbi:hypothetical protein GRF61_15440 [Azoarcus sp. TTM-91]|nr:hypothetical protein [Azoarcus sp. TTM-91]
MIVVAALILFAAAFVSYEALTEAYGAGPPYYSQTTNMDKWRDPLPEILLGDLIATSVSGILIWAGIRKLRQPKL